MTKKIIAKNVIAFEIVCFAVVILSLWADEILDVPHVLFGAEQTPVNWVEGVFETAIICALCIVVVSLTRRFLNEIRYLEGLLSVCSFCKKIRSGKEWISIEKYIQDHSAAEFSHGVCPDCAEKYYGDFVRPDRPESGKS